MAQRPFTVMTPEHAERLLCSPQGPSGHRPPRGGGGLPSWLCLGGRQACSAHQVILPANPSQDPVGVGRHKGR